MDDSHFFYIFLCLITILATNKKSFKKTKILDQRALEGIKRAVAMKGAKLSLPATLSNLQN
jgi:hypothetical protein